MKLKKKYTNEIEKHILDSYRETLRKKGLDKTDLYNQIKVKETSKGFELVYNEYGDFVDSGRKPGSAPPVNGELKKWSEKRGLNVYAVAASIKKKGIKPNKWISKFEDEVVDIDDVIGDIVDDIIKTKIK